jgi:uncharacterized membrane protein
MFRKIQFPLIFFILVLAVIGVFHFLKSIFTALLFFGIVYFVFYFYQKKKTSSYRKNKNKRKSKTYNIFDFDKNKKKKKFRIINGGKK